MAKNIAATLAKKTGDYANTGMVGRLKEETEQLKAELDKARQSGGVSLDYWTSDSLDELEKGIRETVQGVALSKKAVCLALARIQGEELYKQAGLETFKAYLEAERINVPKSTASEYSKIGRTMLEHKKQLDKVTFREEDGLKKLLYLEQALQGQDPTEVFRKVKSDSLREFKSYAAASSRARTEPPAPEREGARVIENIDRLFIQLGGKRIELLTFSPDIEALPGFARFKEQVKELALKCFSA